jgi:hypothetical protein
MHTYMQATWWSHKASSFPFEEGKQAKNAEALLDTNEEIGLELNACMFMSYH